MLKSVSGKPIYLGRVMPMTSDKIHQNQEVHSIRGVCITIKATAYKNPPRILVMEAMPDEEATNNSNI